MKQEFNTQWMDYTIWYQSGVSLTTVNAIADTVSLEFTGGSVSWGVTPVDEAVAYVADYVSGATICLDLPATGVVALNLIYH